MIGDWPSTSSKTPPLPSFSVDTESSLHTQSQDSQDTDDYTPAKSQSKSPETEPHIE